MAMIPAVGIVEGYGPVPGDLLREWIADNLDHDRAQDQDESAGERVSVWVRRVYEHPGSGALVGMDSRARRFTGQLAEFLRIRDRCCRTPWCDAPVRHLDHATGYAEGGATSAENAQGLCVACNHAKQVQGWAARAARVRHGPSDDPGRHTIETVTPTGHTYTSTAPRLDVRPRARTDLRFPLALAV